MSLLCGFLGAGKTTLLKHVLETKHAEENFKCAVIVNDMAALNIDKSLIDQSALVQSDEVIAIQNGLPYKMDACRTDHWPGSKENVQLYVD